VRKLLTIVGLCLSFPAAAGAAVDMVTFVKYADQSGEYPNTLTAISTYFTDYVETSTETTDPVLLGAELVGKDVFLIPEQESSTTGTLGPLGTSWSTVLTDFVNGGGTVIACSWTDEEHLLLNNSGLLSITRTGTADSAPLVIGTPHLLTEGVLPPFTNPYVATYSTVDGTVVVETQAGSEPVVVVRDIGAGHVVMIGMDFYTLGTDFDRIVANAVKWGQHIARVIQ
jgi:hypothetical protein